MDSWLVGRLIGELNREQPPNRRGIHFRVISGPVVDWAVQLTPEPTNQPTHQLTKKKELHKEAPSGRLA
jgi:hypothetical protein